MVDIVVSLKNGAEFDLTAVDIGTVDGDTVLSFTVEGFIRELESDLMQMFVGTSVVPTEIHFRIEGE